MKRKIFTFRGIKINYYLEGQGKPILFLHGGGVSTRSYLSIIKTLSHHYQILAPDLPCFGLSDVPPAIWNLENYGQAIKALVDKCNLKNITVIGHSFGGGVALHTASQTTRISQLILVDALTTTPPFNFTALCWRSIFLQTLEYLLYPRYWSVNLTKAIDILLSFTPKLLKLKQILQVIKHSAYSHYHILTKIKVPTLILWGKDDTVLPLSLGRLAHRKIKGSKLAIVKGRHDWCLAYKKEFFQHIGNFIKS